MILSCILALACAAYFGISHRFSLGGSSLHPGESYGVQERLEVFHPIRENHHFVFLVVGENAAAVCERQLRSIFDQTHPSYEIVYLDNGSVDQTAEKVQAVCKTAKKLDKLHLVRFDKKRPAMQVIYNAIHELNPRDIVLYLDGHDWLSHENVLDHLNCAYAHPDVWLTYSRAIHHPNYQRVDGAPYSDDFLRGKQFRGKRRAAPHFSYHLSRGLFSGNSPRGFFI